MLMEDARRQVAEYGRKMSAAGLSIGTSGNLSAYDPELGLMAIGPSGLDYFQTEAEDVVVMKLDGTIVEGERKPSSEAMLHAGIYRAKPFARGIVHTHSTYCTTLAVLHEPLRAVHYAMAGIGAPEMPVAPYERFGSLELARAVEETMAATPAKGCIMANHGMVVCDTSLAAAFELAANCEWTAGIQWRAMCAGTPVPLTEEQMGDALSAFATYGQPKEDEA